MSEETYLKPLPTPSPEAERYWQACKDHELQIQFCLSCEAFFFYPRGHCPRCLSSDVEWRRVSGRGKVHTFAIHHVAFHPGWQDEVPYVTALVELDEGVRLFTNLVDVDPDPAMIKCDMPVEVVFDDVTEDITLPRFRPVSEEA